MIRDDKVSILYFTQILSYFPLMICFVENQNKLKCFMVTLSWFKKVTFYLEKEIFKYN